MTLQIPAMNGKVAESYSKLYGVRWVQAIHSAVRSTSKVSAHAAGRPIVISVSGNGSHSSTQKAFAGKKRFLQIRSALEANYLNKR